MSQFLNNTTALTGLLRELHSKAANPTDQYEFGVVEGIEQGKILAYEEFWNNYQVNGTRTVYDSAFAGAGWTNATFKPKYPIAVTNAYMMFKSCNISGDLVELMASYGSSLDFSKCTNAYYTFAEAKKITRVGIIDLRKVTGSSSYANHIFYYCTSLVTIEKIILPTIALNFTSAFEQCESLENIIIEGTIKANFNIAHSPLTYASITSIVEALSSAHTGTVTLSKAAVNKAFETTEGANDGSDAAAWTALINTKPTWKFVLHAA